VNPGEVVLIPLPQMAGGPPKLLPALVLAVLPGPYQNRLVCGISSQLSRQEPNWDELLQPGDADFGPSGLHSASVIRLSYLHATDPSAITGMIGHIDSPRLTRLRTRLAAHLRP
jgi:mRNA interferase MazF